MNFTQSNYSKSKNLSQQQLRPLSACQSHYGMENGRSLQGIFYQEKLKTKDAIFEEEEEDLNQKILTGWKKQQIKLNKVVRPRPQSLRNNSQKLTPIPQVHQQEVDLSYAKSTLNLMKDQLKSNTYDLKPSPFMNNFSTKEDSINENKISSSSQPIKIEIQQLKNKKLFFQKENFANQRNNLSDLQQDSNLKNNESIIEINEEEVEENKNCFVGNSETKNKQNPNSLKKRRSTLKMSSMIGHAKDKYSLEQECFSQFQNDKIKENGLKIGKDEVNEIQTANLSQIIEDQNQQIINLKKNNQKKKDDLIELKKSLQKQIESRKVREIQQQEQILSLNQQIKKDNIILLNHEEKWNLKIEELKQFTLENEHLKQQIEDLNKNAEINLALRNNFENQLIKKTEESQKTIQTLNAKISELKKQQKMSPHQLESLIIKHHVDRINQLSSQKQDLGKVKEKESNGKSIENLIELNSNLEKEKNDLNELIRQLQDQNNILRRKYLNNNQQEKEIKQLFQEGCESDLNECINRLQSQLKEQKQENNSLLNRIQELSLNQKTKYELDTLKMRKDQRIQGLKDKSEEQIKIINELLSQMEEQKSKNNSLQNQIYELQGQNQQIYEELKALKISKSQEIEDLKDQLNEQKSQNDSLSNKIEELNNLNLNTEKELSTLKISKDQEIQELNDKSEEYLIKINELQTELSEQKSENNSLLNKMEELLDLNSKLEEELDTLKINKDQEIQELNKKSEEQINKIYELQNQLSQQESENHSLSSKNQELLNLKQQTDAELITLKISKDQEIQDLRDQSEEQLSKINELLTELSVSKSENYQLSNQIEELLDQNQKLEEELYTLKINNDQEIQELRSQCEGQIETIQLLETENNELSQQNTEQQYQYQELFVINEQTTNENDQLKQQISKMNSQKNELQIQKKFEVFQQKLSLKNLNNDTPREDMIEYLQLLNKDSNIDDTLIQFTKQLVVIAQNQLTNEQKEISQLNTKKICEKVKNRLNQNQDVQESLMASVILQKFYKKNNITVYINNSNQISDSVKQQIQDTLLFTGGISQGQYFSLQFANSSDFQSALQNEDSLHQYVESLKREIGSYIQIPEQEAKNSIIVMRVGINNDNKIDFVLKNQLLDKVDKLKSFRTPKVKVLVQNLIDHSFISKDFFDPNNDQNWDDYSQGTYGYRGALPNKKSKNQFQSQPYYYPVGFQGYGLNVINKYGNDIQWILQKTNLATWIVLFHGTASSNIKSILTSYLKQGKRNNCGGLTCRITEKQITSGEFSNVYLSDRVEIAENYCYPDASFNGNKYKVVFQCRVNPKGVRSPKDYPQFYTVENSQQDIRPYRLLIKML